MPASQASTVPGVQFSKKYRTKSKLSFVDEMLFADKAQPYEEAYFPYSMNRNAPPMAKVEMVYKGPRKPKSVRLYTKDLIRDLVVPHEDPSGNTVILAPSKYSRILKATEFKSRNEGIKTREEAQAAKEQRTLASQKKKEEFAERDLMRLKNQKLTDLELEAKDKALALMEETIAKRLEQEDDIKRLNELCLNARCHAIRDAQMVEKKIIGEELAAEEKRLDNMMEIDRINAIKQQEHMEDMLRAERFKGAAEVMNQIEKKAEKKLIDLEVKDMEGQQMLRYLEKLQKEDLESLDVKRTRQKKLWKEITEILEAYERKKKDQKEQDLAADKRVLDFLQEKEDREIAKEKEEKRKRKEREYEIARLRNMQQRALYVHEERLAIRLKRSHEQQEREWRKREEKEAIKKAETEAILKKAREEQIRSKQHFMAVEVQRDRREFDKVLRKLKKDLHEQHLKEERERNERFKHGEKVRQQIIERETVKLGERKAFFQEGIELEEKEKKRKIKLEKAKNQKLDKLRETGVPERYCKEVERRLNVPERLMQYLA